MFLHVLLWICEPGCAACGNGYTLHRPGTAEPDRTVRRYCVPKYTSYQHKTEEFRRDALQKGVRDRQEQMQRYLANQAAKLAAKIRTGWSEYFTDDNFRMFCCLVCSERVFGHEVQWVPEGDIKCEVRGILEVLADVHRRSDLRPTTSIISRSGALQSIIEPRGLHRANDSVPGGSSPRL
ncbi:BQ2448_1365 [Microbotryum intermedium]|uniref:BQ2448_1365 protein n=1 Tax=Microbotryum intermedium TaxID=269621 RepID=A0A238FCY3_9BASI|nr:BQ2448_1365 [Microbotryum intermedium]